LSSKRIAPIESARRSRLYQGKHYFTIHDFVDAYHMFNDDEWDGNSVTVEQFISKLFDTLKLPEFMKSEEELRRLWSNPITRLELLKSLDDHGFSKDDLIQLK
jgi:type I site-specific restriction endonuclease